MKQSVWILIVGAAVSFYGGCRQSGKTPLEKATAPLRPVPPGKVERIHCARDTFLSYSVYVPASYSEERQWPVMYFWDPHARGFLPVKCYQALADTYGYILVASFDSRNRQPVEFGRRIFEAMRMDIGQRWKVHPYRQYVCGFSGGARLAAMLIKDDPDIAGIIGCGAGWPTENSAGRPSVAIGGSKDFNLYEIRRMTAQADSLWFLLIEFDGLHEWPPAETMRWAWDWLETQAMRQRLIPNQPVITESILRRHFEEIRRFKEKGAIGEQTLLYRRLIRMLSQLDDTREYEETLAELERLRRVHQYFQSQKRVMREESRYREIYARAMGSESLAWWKVEIRRLRQPPKEKPPEEYRAMHDRLRQWISLLSYQYLSAAVAEQKKEETAQALTIYRMADPDNPAVDYFEALHRLLLNDRKSALQALHRSADKGYDDILSAEDEPLLNPLRSDSAFMQWMKRVRRNAENLR